MATPDSPPRTWTSWAGAGRLKRWWLHFVVFALMVVGVVAVASAVGWPLAVLAGVLALLTSFRSFNEVAGRIAGATIVGTLVLLAADVGIYHVFGRLPILCGLVAAVVVFGAAVAWYLRGTDLRTGMRWARGSRWSWGAATSVAAILATLLLVDVPIVVEADAGAHAVWWVGGAALAAVALGLAARWRFHAHPLPRAAVTWVGVLCAPLVPLVGVDPHHERGDQERVAKVAVAVKHFVDVRIIADGTPHAGSSDLSKLPLDPALAVLNPTFSVGFRDGEGVSWARVGVNRETAVQTIAAGRQTGPSLRPPITREGADAVLLLLVDGTPPVVGGSSVLPDAPASAKEVGLWRRVSHSARERGMPSFALLQTRDARRLRRWGQFTSAGGVVTLQQLGRRVLPDAGVALAVGATTAQADLALAIKHRPILLFDSKEPVPRPLSVDWLFTHDKVGMCTELRIGRTDDCPSVRPGQLVNGGTHLRFEKLPAHGLRRQQEAEAARCFANTPTDGAFARPVEADALLPAAGTAAAPAAACGGAGAPIDAGPETTIYVHPVSVESANQRLVYLDYWWYLASNPVPIGDGALCGAGLVIAGKTCHDHDSDWEGLTVLVDRTRAATRVLSVNYAQHDSVVRYDWDGLRTVWDGQPASFATSNVDHPHERPMAYVAKGTHSTYPLPCRASACPQVAGGPEDSRHDGGRAWLGNYTPNCGAASCVQDLPTTAAGKDPALWNGFEGVWGEKHCELTYYCDTTTPPKAPGQQGRYRSPVDCDGEGTIEVKKVNGRISFKTAYRSGRSCH